MREHRALDLGRPDAVAARADDVVLARVEPDVAVGVHVREVAGPVPAVAAQRLGGLLRLVVVALEQHGVVGLRDDLTLLAARHLVAVHVEDAQVEVGDRQAEAAGADLVARAVRARAGAVLGLAVATRRP